MTVEYHTAHFVVGEIMPETQPQKALSDLVFMVRHKVADMLEDESVGLGGTHPKILISMIVTNILVNMIYLAIGATDIAIRHKMFTDCLNEVCEMSKQLWNALEAGSANTDIAH